MSITSGLNEIAAFLATIAEILSFVYLLATWANYGIAGLILYLIGWEIVGVFFDVIGKRIPSPLRVLWKILRSIAEITV
jgi:hypothetical protein